MKNPAKKIMPKTICREERGKGTAIIGMSANIRVTALYSIAYVPMPKKKSKGGKMIF